MSIVLRLDASALAAMFPDGSPARLELQNAVVMEAAKKMAMKTTTFDVAKVQKLVSDESRKHFDESGISVSWNGSASLSTSMKNKIAEQCKESMNKEIAAACERARKEGIAEIERQLSAALIDHALQKRLDKLAADSIKKAFGGMTS